MQAHEAYTACMQYTLRNVPRHLDETLRRRARAEGRSLNDVAMEALARGAGLGEEKVRYRDLSGIAGTWVEDPECERVLAEQDRVDEDLWK
jgi:plasmid stability protein